MYVPFVTGKYTDAAVTVSLSGRTVRERGQRHVSSLLRLPNTTGAARLLIAIATTDIT
jgi:DNA-binding sugar fermentation-stimulating protein